MCYYAKINSGNIVKYLKLLTIVCIGLIQTGTQVFDEHERSAEVKQPRLGYYSRQSPGAV